MILGHIGVRAGSKGVPGKNFRKLAGKPLIEWSLDQLIAHPMIDQIVVSTDSQDIHEFALKKGTVDIGLRPAVLASDTASKWNVWEHALERAEARLGSVAMFVDLDATAPLRLEEDITSAINLFQTEAPDMVMSVCEARKNPYFNLVEPDETGALQVSKQLPGNVVARQQAPVVYEHVGSVYVLDPDYLKRADWIYDGRVIPFEMPVERTFDIDAEIDFDWVEYLMNRRLAQK